MNDSFLIIIVFLVLPLTLFSQNDTIDRVYNKSAEFYFVGTSFSMVGKDKNEGKPIVGFEVGLLPELLNISFITGLDNPFSLSHKYSFGQIIFGHLFVRMKRPKNCNIDIGLRISQFFGTVGEAGPDSDISIIAPKFFGFYFKPVWGKKQWRFGFRVDVGVLDGPAESGSLAIFLVPTIRHSF